MVNSLVPGYLKYDGQKYIIDPNPIGPPGVPGQQGPPGATGPQGPPGSGSGSSNSNIFVYQEGGTNNSNIYNSFLGSYNAADAAREFLPTIIIDNSLGNPVILSGNYNFDNIILKGMIFSSGEVFQTVLQINDGVNINFNYGFVIDNLTINCIATSNPIINYNSGSNANIYCINETSIQITGNGTQPFIFANGGIIKIFGGFFSSRNNSGTYYPALVSNPGNIINLYFDNQNDGLTDQTLSGTGNFFINVSSLLANVSTSHIATTSFNFGFSGDTTSNGAGTQTVIGIQNNAISNTTPTDGQFLVYVGDSNHWQPYNGTKVFAYNTSQQNISGGSSEFTQPPVAVTNWTAVTNTNFLNTSSFNISTGVFTAPITGTYHVTASLEFNVTSVRTGAYFKCLLVGSGSIPTIYHSLVAGYTTGDTNYPGNPIISASLFMNEGDQFTVKAQQNTWSSAALTNNSQANFISIASP